VVRSDSAIEGPLGPIGVRGGAGVKRVSRRTGRAGVLDGSLGRAIVDTARRLTGVPYHWGGRTFAGVDCSGLVQLAARAHGIRLPRDARDQCRALGGITRLVPFDRALDRSGAPGRGTIRPGDLWFFGPNRREVTHVALSSGSLDLIHAYGQVRAGSLDPLSDVFEPELFRFVLGWKTLPGPGALRSA
jgi:cell wall-associated NlpC family hydrolase